MKESATFDSLLQQHIAAEVSAQLPAVVSEQLKEIKPLPEWMTETLLAEYWQLRNREGELTTAGIRSWGERAPDEHPLPYINCGEFKRYHRTQVDQWAQEEVEWQRKRLRARREQRQPRKLHAVEKA